MTNLAKKISELKTDQYDKKIFTHDEIGKKINPDTARGLKLCEELNFKGGDILASEIIHTRAELLTLKEDKPSFREQNKNDEKIIELENLVSELETLLREKIDHAARMKAYKAREDAHSEAISALEPLADELKAIETKLKDNFADIRVLQNSVFGNPINQETFRLMEAIGRPSGIFN